MSEAPIQQHIEALIFSAQGSISEEDIRMAIYSALQVQLSKADVEAACLALEKKYADAFFSFRPVRIGGGYQFLTKPDYFNVVNVLQQQQSKKKLSQAAIETLAIIAYRQPITKLEIEQIRGVNSDYSVQRLLEKELISIAGKSDGPGKPILYGTSAQFMDYFALSSIDQLPRLKDIAADENSIGAVND
ncbi:SMC-Scp complex subunit ScpB [Pedobacter yulinensis]|uniref:SMC-Scp complex subunit ScpB n=1 Tax=Pedobacter yulinensis TaxID=2126353 RepID=A0A2T3HI59_9SPHI|nr:SMC-Scp complex subunit ScpB [Pedobacter yulinensis]PST82128.1 SMC-Scp complex subunit ScpB [Pedobacter yulinensis]